MPRLLLMKISVSGTCWMRRGCAFGCSGIGDYGFRIADSGEGFVELLLAAARDRDGDACNREGLGDGEAVPAEPPVAMTVLPPSCRSSRFPSCVCLARCTEYMSLSA